MDSICGTTLWPQAECSFNTQEAQCRYGTNGKNFTPVDAAFIMHFTLATFYGERFGMFKDEPMGSHEWLDIASFRQDGT